MRGSAVVTLLALLGWALMGSAPAGADAPPISVSATVNGQDVAAASAKAPLRLDPGKSVDIAVVVTNRGSAPLVVKGVELDGRVLGLSFFSYITAVDHTVAPGATDTVRYRLDLVGLSGQATGLIGGRLALTDAADDVVATIPTVTDVRGSLVSVYGLFGIAVLVLTVLAILDSAFALARHRLSSNRWKRGLRLLLPGIGIALVLAFTASVARWWVPDTGQWLMAAGISAAVFFLGGYFSPTPGDEEDDDEFGEDSDDSEAVSAPDTDQTMIGGSGR